MFRWLSNKRNKTANPKQPPFLLNLGCGARFHGDWVNLDVVSQDSSVIGHNLYEPLPFADASCAVVYHSHVLEHFSHSAVPAFLKECQRVLIPGGVVRVVVPDLETIARLYLKNLEAALAGDPKAALRCEWMTLELLDQMVREHSGGEMLKYWQQNPMPAEEFVLERMGGEVRQVLNVIRKGGPPPATASEAPKQPTPAAVGRFRAGGEVHKWMYDRWSLRVLLQKSGFTEIQARAAHESRIPDFKRYRLDLNDDDSVRKPDSLFMEACKP